MFRSDDIRIFYAKTLLVLALALMIWHLILFHRSVSRETAMRQVHQAWTAELPKDRYRIGADEESFRAFLAFDPLIDSLLTRDYGIRASWIKNEPVNFDNRLYRRKIVQIPESFPTTTFNADLKLLAEQNAWPILSVQEKMKTGDLWVDIGRDEQLYLHMQLNVNKRLKTDSKDLYLLISGMGIKNDEITAAILDLPENITLIIPRGQEFSTLLTHEAKRNGKAVLNRLPEYAKTVYLDPYEADETTMTKIFYETLQNVESGTAIVCYEKPVTIAVLKRELPKVTRRGYRFLSFTR